MRFLYYLAIYPYNFLIFPYFNNLGRISTAWMWLLTFGTYFALIGGLLLWPVVHWYIRKRKKSKKPKHLNTFFKSLAISTINTVLLISLFFLLGYITQLTIPNTSLGTSPLFPHIFLTILIVLTSLLNYFIANFVLHNQIFSIKPMVYLFTFFTSLFTALLMVYVLFGPSISLCTESNRLYDSSGYAAHGNELCFQRQDTSECPQSPSELKAFRPQDYEKLQSCYYPAKTHNGYILYPRFLDADIF